MSSIHLSALEGDVTLFIYRACTTLYSPRHTESRVVVDVSAKTRSRGWTSSDFISDGLQMSLESEKVALLYLILPPLNINSVHEQTLQEHFIRELLT